MNGLQLAELFYTEQCAPMLRRSFPTLMPRIAAGLVGEGSECMGFDDAISRDHDWGAGLCLWLNDDDYAQEGDRLAKALASLPDTFQGYPVRASHANGAQRTGVWRISDFYFRYLGSRTLPQTPKAWLTIPEDHLATATNGKVFADPAGEFTRLREALLAFYPEDVRRKKLAARCAIMGQAGQYNLPRCLARKEFVAAAMAEAAFIEAACSALFLLHKRYKPFYKWAHHGLALLPAPAGEVATALTALVQTQGGFDQGGELKVALIERICTLVTAELHKQHLSSATDSFMLPQAESVQASITDPTLRALHLMLG
ncbi:DUF4037 domain-containing protein [Desulfovibrio cuneatus]|uniref:DUF4037 domain-containing protein n=1 Tax=Desulfovibrio cuneatus TaxID=159728 RepID=UPI0003F6C0E7|nr:DUF4037 domain-containing protein [Desulfovibrio cuneatus]